MIPFLLNNFNISTNPSSPSPEVIGLSITPIQLPFTNILELLAKYSVEHSNFNFIGVFALNHLINGLQDEPLVI